MKRLFYLIVLLLALAGCKREAAQSPAVQTRIMGVDLGDGREAVLRALYAQGFNDASSGLQDQRFDTIAMPGGDMELKVLLSGDTAGYACEGVRWNDLQIQLDRSRLQSVTLHTAWAPLPQVLAWSDTLVARLMRRYPLATAVVGQEQRDGRMQPLRGYRYSDGHAMVQLHQNTTPDSLASLSLSLSVVAAP